MDAFDEIREEKTDIVARGRPGSSLSVDEDRDDKIARGISLVTIRNNLRKGGLCKTVAVRTKSIHRF